MNGKLVLFTAILYVLVGIIQGFLRPNPPLSNTCTAAETSEWEGKAKTKCQCASSRKSLPSRSDIPCTEEHSHCHEENRDDTTLTGRVTEGDILCGVQTSSGIGEKVFEIKTNTWSSPIFYQVDTKFSKIEKAIITKAINDTVRNVTQNMRNPDCLEIKEEKNDDGYILFKKGNGFYSSVGKVAKKGTPQTITLPELRDYNKGNVIHELMHAFGFWHEHVRPDRQDYVDVTWSNIKTGAEVNFIKLAENEVKAIYKAIAYDPCSIMHYGPKAFSKNGDETLVLKDKNDERRKCMGQRQQLKSSDIERIRKMFQCKLKE